MTLYLNFSFFQNIKSFLKLDWERWKVEISEQYLHCLVQSVYKLTFYIVVVH